MNELVKFGQRNHDKFLQTFGSGYADKMIRAQAKILFDYQLKRRMHHEQMSRLSVFSNEKDRKFHYTRYELYNHDFEKSANVVENFN